VAAFDDVLCVWLNDRCARFSALALGRMLHSQVIVHRMARKSCLIGNQRDLGSLGTEFVNLVIAFDALLMVSIVPFLFAVGTSFECTSRDSAGQEVSHWPK